MAISAPVSPAVPLAVSRSTNTVTAPPDVPSRVPPVESPAIATNASALRAPPGPSHVWRRRKPLGAGYQSLFDDGAVAPLHKPACRRRDGGLLNPLCEVSER